MQLQAALLGLQFIWTRDVQLALGKTKTEKGIIQSAWRRVGVVLSELTAIAQKEVQNSRIIYVMLILLTVVPNGTHKVGNLDHNSGPSA